MSAPAYRIVDEPRAGALANIVVRPFFPLLALMLAGGWIAWPWFALNAVAVGSVTRTREIVVAGLGLVGMAAIVLVIAVLASTEVLSGYGLRYALLVVTLYKLAIGYVLHHWQDQSVVLHEHYGGRLRNAAGVLIAATLASAFVGSKLPTLVRLVLL